jgi:hypothetical protein
MRITYTGPGRTTLDIPKEILFNQMQGKNIKLRLNQSPPRKIKEEKQLLLNDQISQLSHIKNKRNNIYHINQFYK